MSASSSGVTGQVTGIFKSPHTRRGLLALPNLLGTRGISTRGRRLVFKLPPLLCLASQGHVEDVSGRVGSGVSLKTAQNFSPLALEVRPQLVWTPGEDVETTSDPYKKGKTALDVSHL